MLAVFVRLVPANEAFPTSDGPTNLASEDGVIAVLPTDLRGYVRAGALVARTSLGPFLPLDQAIRGDPRLADDLADALELPPLVRYRRLRRWLAFGLVPIAVLAELERELMAAHVEGVGPRFMADAFLLVLLGLDLTRRVPRLARVATVVLLGIAARYAYLIARSCGAYKAMFPFLAIAGIASLAMAILAPSRSALRRGVLEHLGDPLVRAAPLPEETSTDSRIGGALAVAFGLPLALIAARACGVGLLLQGALLVAVAIVGPALVDRKRIPLPRSGKQLGDRAIAIASAVSAGLAVTLGLTHIAHYGVGSLAYGLACEAPSALDGLARQLLDAEVTERARSFEGAQAKWILAAMSVLVVPLAEERVFRDMLQRRLVHRLGSRRGLAGASLAFGLAHVGVYRAAMVQAGLLGVGFGLAYEEAGLLGAVLTHALWNLYSLG